MSNIVTSILIGSIESLPIQYCTIDGGAQTIPAGPYYLYDPTASRSLVASFQAMMVAAGLSNPRCFVGKNKKVQLTADSAFSIVWTSTTLRDLLGFTTNFAGSSSYEATNISKLLWSPSYRGRSATPLGIAAYDMDDTEITKNQAGTTCISTTYNTAKLQELDWDSVHVSNVWTSSELGGEFKPFRDLVLQPVARLYHYDNVIENEALSTEIDFVSGTRLGPYKIRDPMNNWYIRKISQVDLYSPISLDLIKVAEYA